MFTDFLEIVSRFPQIRALVAGDLLLDHYIAGTTERISPEAPVPVLHVQEERYLAGGAANVARNAAVAGARVDCIGLTGRDGNGDILLNALKDDGIHTGSTLQAESFQTILKSRVVAQGQQIVRLDYEKCWEPAPGDVERLCRNLDGAMAQADVVLVSDYGKGFCRQETLHYIMEAARARNLRVIVDPKGRDYSRYRGAQVITPNAREAYEATGIATIDKAGLERAALRIHEVTGCEIVVITRGAEGIALRQADGVMAYVPTAAREVFDVTGAGDTFITWLALGLTAGLAPKEACELANIAAGISVSRVGPAVVSPLDIRQALVPGAVGKKIMLEAELGKLAAQLRAEGKSIVLANGCFDFLHAGHVAFMQGAKALGDVLIVATNTDESIAKLKGAGRPVIVQAQRERLLAAIGVVDYVTVFSGEVPDDLIRAVQPDVLVKGSNFTADQVQGADIVAGYGGRIALLPITHDFHTGQILGQG